MKIRNEYPVYSGQNYATHSSTARENTVKPSQEEGHGKNDFPGENGGEGYRIRRQNVELTLHTAMPKESAEKVSGQDSVLKEFWNRLGEEPQGDKMSLLSVLKEKVWSPLYGVFLRMGEALKDFFAKDSEGGFNGLSSRFKAELSAALKRIGKGNLHGLTDGQTLSNGGFTYTDSRKEPEKKKEQMKDKEPVTYARGSHIMDSYTKDGTYCTLGDVNYHRTDRNAAYPKRNEGEE